MTEEPPLRDLLQRGYRYALSLTHDPDEAEDLVQDAALSISRRAGPWTMPFLITIIRNRFIDLYRRNKRVPFEALDEQVYDTYEDDDLPESVEKDQMEAILGGLKSAEREILYLSAVEEYTTAEIAEMTGRPRGTVLSLLHRTKLKLRKRLTHEAGY